METSGAPPTWMRRIVWCFLVAFVVCGVAGIEAWPLSGFRLFSSVREQVQTSWVATVATNSDETAFQPHVDDAAFGGNGYAVSHFASMSTGEQLRACTAWLKAVEANSVVRIYRVDTDLAKRDGDRGQPGTRVLAYTCDVDGVHAQS